MGNEQQEVQSLVLHLIYYNGCCACVKLAY